MISLKTLTRVCGDCQECCRLVGVQALHKPACTPCQHQTKGGCGIYDMRPTECREYHCAWLHSSFDMSDDQRPDKIGIIIDAEGDLVVVSETRPGAFDTPQNARMIGILFAAIGNWPTNISIKFMTYGATLLAGTNTLLSQYQVANRIVLVAPKEYKPGRVWRTV